VSDFEVRFFRINYFSVFSVPVITASSSGSNSKDLTLSFDTLSAARRTVDNESEIVSQLGE
jgi:hypothetical protein